jgi:hypothetical protein
MDEQLNRIEHRLLSIEQKVDDIMAGQASIDAAVTAFTAFLTDLSTDVAAIKTELANGGTVDTTQLDALVAGLPAAQAALDALANPVPPVSASASTAFRPQT